MAQKTIALIKLIIYYRVLSNQGEPWKIGLFFKKSGKNNKILAKLGKSHGIFSVISLFYFFEFNLYLSNFYQYLLVSLSMSTFSSMPCLLASLFFE